MSSLTW
jgi:hypothetical protein